MMPKVQDDQKARLVEQIRAAGSRGRTRKSMCYLERRHQDLGDDLTIDSLNQLVEEGVLRVEVTGPKKFKTVSERDAKRGYVYYVN